MQQSGNSVPVLISESQVEGSLAEAVRPGGICSRLDQQGNQICKPFDAGFVKSASRIERMNAVHVRSTSNQQRSDLKSVMEHCCIESRIAVYVSPTDIHMRCEQQVDNLSVASRRREVKHGLIVAVPSIEASSRCKQQFDSVGLPGQHCTLQRSRPVLGSGDIDERSVHQKKAHDFRVAEPGGDDEGCAAQGVRRIHVRACEYQALHLIEISCSN